MENNYINLQPNKSCYGSQTVEGHLKESITDLENRRFKNRSDYLLMVQLKEKLNNISLKKTEIIEEYKKRERLIEYTSVKASKIFEIYCSKELDDLSKSIKTKSKTITHKIEFLKNKEKEYFQEDRMISMYGYNYATVYEPEKINQIESLQISESPSKYIFGEENSQGSNIIEYDAEIPIVHIDRSKKYFNEVPKYHSEYLHHTYEGNLERIEKMKEIQRLSKIDYKIHKVTHEM